MGRGLCPIEKVRERRGRKRGERGEKGKGKLTSKQFFGKSSWLLVSSSVAI